MEQRLETLPQLSPVRDWICRLVTGAWARMQSKTLSILALRMSSWFTVRCKEKPPFCKYHDMINFLPDPYCNYITS